MRYLFVVAATFLVALVLVTQVCAEEHEDTNDSALTVALPTTEEIKAMTRSERIHFIYNAVNKESMHLLGEFYAEDVVFEDPLGRIEGLAGLRAYYENMYKNVQEISFEITDEVEQGEKHVICWTLRMKVKGLNKGKEVSCLGNSFLRFNEAGLVIYHRDYFDMGEFIYQHVPVLKFLVRKVNERLEHKSE